MPERCVPLDDGERSVTIVLPEAVIRKATVLAIDHDTTVEEMFATIVTKRVSEMRLMREVCDEGD